MSVQLLERLGSGAIVLREPRWKVNLTAIPTAEGAIIVDAFPSPYDAHEAIRLIEEHLGMGVAVVVNTHHHYDHVLGNQAYSGARIIAHERCKERMIGFQDRLMELVPKRRRLKDYVPTYPTETITETTDQHIGGVHIRLLWNGPAHTDNDLTVYVPEMDLLATSDVHVPNTVYHINLNSGCDIQNWIEMLERFADELPPETVVVPGHLEVGGLGPLREQALYMRSLLMEVRSAFNAGWNLSEALKRVDMSAFAEFINFQRFNHMNISSAWRYCFGNDAD